MDLSSGYNELLITIFGDKGLCYDLCGYDRTEACFTTFTVVAQVLSPSWGSRAYIALFPWMSEPPPPSQGIKLSR